MPWIVSGIRGASCQLAGFHLWEKSQPGKLAWQLALRGTSMAAKKKSWREKLADSKGLPKVGKIEGKMTRRWGTGTMVIPGRARSTKSCGRSRRGNC